MLIGGVAASAAGLLRLRHNDWFADRSRPSMPIARTVVAFGARAQLGNLLWLINLRLDFMILDAIAGPAVLGIYAVASKAAELMRLPATAVNYVLYPRFTRQPPEVAAREARTLLPRACGLTVVATPLLVIASGLALPLLFGQRFHAAVEPAWILLIGLAVEGAAAVASAYLCGSGRPGANSFGMGLGVVVTVVLDVMLIPGHQAVGAAVASTAAYLVTTSVLTGLTWRSSRRALSRANGQPATQ
jgi:O-antigen/teichoic acid export membrane protein